MKFVWAFWGGGGLKGEGGLKGIVVLIVHLLVEVIKYFFLFL